MNEFVIHKSLNSRRKEFIDLCEVATQCHKDRTPYKQAIFKMCKTVEADFFRCDRDEVDGVPYVTAYFCFPKNIYDRTNFSIRLRLQRMRHDGQTTPTDCLSADAFRELISALSNPYFTYKDLGRFKRSCVLPISNQDSRPVAVTTTAPITGVISVPIKYKTQDEIRSYIQNHYDNIEFEKTDFNLAADAYIDLPGL